MQNKGGNSDYSRHGSGGGGSPEIWNPEILTIAFWPCDIPVKLSIVKYTQVLKTMFLCPQGRVIHAIRRVVQYWWTKLNTFISSVLSMNFFCYGVLYLQVATLAVRYQI